MAGIERGARILKKNASRDQELPTLSIIEAPESDALVSSSDPLPQCTMTLSFFSPEQLRDKTMQRIRNCSTEGPISPVSESASIVDRTPERAEFGNHECLSGSDLELDLNSSPSASDMEDDLGECEISPSECRENTRTQSFGVGEDETVSEDEHDDLEEDDLEELERTVLQYSDENPERPLTEAQVVSVIENINRRRNVQTTIPTYLEGDEAQNEICSREGLDKGSGVEDKAGIHISGISSDENSVQEISAVSRQSAVASDIKKKKTADLERLRSVCRLKAMLKTDEELGLALFGQSCILKTDRRNDWYDKENDRKPTESTPADEKRSRSKPAVDSSTPLSSNSCAISPPCDEIGPSNNAVESEGKKVQSQLFPACTGLLSRLFSPDTVRKCKASPLSNQHANTDFIHSESRKETNILGSAVHRLKMRQGEIHFKVTTPGTNPRCSSLHQTDSLLGTEVDSREVPCAAVAPSPRLEADAVNSSHILVNERNIKLFQKRAEKIRRQHDDERRRGAQEIQRGLEECEIRLEEINDIGQSLEHKLADDPENEKLMDSWFALLHERELLKSKEEMLRLSKKEVELEVKYRDLNVRFKQLGDGVNEDLSANSELLAAMLSVVEERKEVYKQIQDAKQGFKKINLNMKLLKERSCDFRKFRPVFASH